MRNRSLRSDGGKWCINVALSLRRYRATEHERLHVPAQWQTPLLMSISTLTCEDNSTRSLLERSTCRHDPKEARLLTFSPHHFGIKVGDEQASGLVDCVGTPLLRICQVQHLLPIAEDRDDLEGLGHLARRVPAAQRAS